jgi:HEAT repeat protein
LTYEEPSPISKAEVQRILSLGASEEIEKTLVAVAFHEKDFEFALQSVLACAASADAGIRGTAILCLGHLARIHGRLPDDSAIDIVRAGLSDPSEYVRGQAENAADDIELFVPSIGRRIRRT